MLREVGRRVAAQLQTDPADRPELKAYELYAGDGHWRGFSVRYLVNYSGERITAFNATAPQRNTYRAARTVENLGFAYQFKQSFTVT